MANQKSEHTRTSRSTGVVVKSWLASEYKLPVQENGKWAMKCTAHGEIGRTDSIMVATRVGSETFCSACEKGLKDGSLPVKKAEPVKATPKAKEAPKATPAPAKATRRKPVAAK